MGDNDRIEVFEKTTPTIEFTLTDKDTGTAIDLTGYILKFAAQSTPGGALIFDATCGTAANGVASVTLGTDNLSATGQYVANLEMTKGTFKDVVLELDFFIKDKVRS